MANAIIVWNTLYIERAIAHLRRAGQHVAKADIARLALLGYAHLNVLGRYTFALPEPITKIAWHPLRTMGEG